MTISDEPTRASLPTEEIGYGSPAPSMTPRAQKAWNQLGILTPAQRQRKSVASVRCGRDGCSNWLMPIYRIGGDLLAVPRPKVQPLDRDDHSDTASWGPQLPFILGEAWGQPPVPLWCKCGWPFDGMGHVLVDPRNLIVILNNTAERNLVVGASYAGVELRGYPVQYPHRRGR